jgi:hypothetical protein
MTEEHSTRYKVLNVLLFMVSFGLARTTVFVQLIATPLVAESMTLNTHVSSIFNTFPLAFFYYGGTFMVIFKIVDRNSIRQHQHLD